MLIMLLTKSELQRQDMLPFCLYVYAYFYTYIFSSVQESMIIFIFNGILNVQINTVIYFES